MERIRTDSFPTMHGSISLLFTDLLCLSTVFQCYITAAPPGGVWRDAEGGGVGGFHRVRRVFSFPFVLVLD